MHATLDPQLAKLTLRYHKGMTKAEKAKAAEDKPKNEWRSVDFDGGVSFYYVVTRDFELLCKGISNI